LGIGWILLGLCLSRKKKKKVTDVMKMTVKELKVIAKEYGITVSGTKKQLILRILHYQFKNNIVTGVVNDVYQQFQSLNFMCICDMSPTEGELIKCKRCCHQFHSECVNYSENWICDNCIFFIDPPSIFRRTKWHKFTAHLPQLQEAEHTLFPFVSMEEEGESTFHQSTISNFCRSNHFDSSNINSWIIEEKQEEWKQKYGNANHSQLHYLPIIKKHLFTNLKIFPCVWNSLWSPLESAWKEKISDLLKNPLYHDKIKFCAQSKAFYFNWNCDNEKTHNLCFCIQFQHNTSNEYITFNWELLNN